MAITEYTPTVWNDGAAPPRSAANLNKQEQGIKAATDEVNALDGRVQTLEDVGAVDSTQYTPQTTDPTYEEGQLWYDDNTKSLALNTDAEEEPQFLGKALHIRVVNNTAAIITAGMAVRYAGAAIGGLPTIMPAQADTVANARVMGIAPYNIAIGETGFIISSGIVNGIDTTAYTPGEGLYLSETVPGLITHDAPPIVSIIGQSLTADISGKFSVILDNFSALPMAYVSMLGGTGPASITTTWQDISGYASVDNIIMSGDITTGEIAIPVDGSYSLGANLGLRFDDVGGGNIPDIYMRTIGDGGYVGPGIPLALAKNAETATFYPSAIRPLPGGQNIKIQISASQTITGVTYPLSSFKIEAKHLTP